MKLTFKTTLIFLAIIVLFACQTEKSKHLTIGISKGIGGAGYLQYTTWLKSLDSTIEIENFYGFSIDSAKKLLKKCDGLLLSGGPDVHPNFYGKPEYDSLCEIDNYRDTLEFALIKSALDNKMPIMGICRGFQILNVALGGQLYADIPTQLSQSVRHRCENKDSCLHKINFIAFDENLDFMKNHLNNIIVNSNHHQGVSYLAEVLQPLAISDDGLIEAFSWKNPKGKSFLLAVQWHPERLSKINPNLSDSLGIRFLKATRNFYKTK